jgi:large subunit ribosomal protein L1
MSKTIQKLSADSDTILSAISKLELSKKRRFNQTYEIIVNLADVDLKKVANKMNLILKLPNKISKESKVCIFAEKDVAKLAEEAGADAVIRKSDLDKLQGNKRELKKLAKKYNFYLAQPEMMPVVGKLLGQYLGAKGKLPQVLHPNTDVANLVKDLKQSVRIRIKNQPTLSCAIGKEGDDPKKLAENAIFVINEIQRVLAGEGRIKSVYIKKTMSNPIRVR